MDKYKKIIFKEALTDIKTAKEHLRCIKDIGKEDFEGCIIDFKEGEDFNTILDIETNIGTIKFPGWITLKKHKNLDSSYIEDSIATWIKEKNFPDNYRYIVFENPVSYVSIKYFSFFPVKLIAFDSNNNVLKVVEGKKNWNDENGYSDISDLNIDLINNKITHIKVESFAEYVGIDSLKAYKQIDTQTSKPTNESKNSNEFDTFFIALCIYLLFFHKGNNNYYHNNKNRRK
ncbi:hypothetical protein NRP93_002898 [Clostridium botulinum]|nr:hypothetical protein [Clostridium botulinum]